MITIIVPTWNADSMYYKPVKGVRNVYVGPVENAVPDVEVRNTKRRLGAVESMAVAAAGLEGDEGLIGFIHDDVEIQDEGWVERIEEFFGQHPSCGLAGFGGAKGLGLPQLYKVPYNYTQLARVRFMSNMTDAEAHGERYQLPTRVSVLDGFCQIFRAEAYKQMGGWQQALKEGLTYHMYDAWAACRMVELGWKCYMIPISCTHHGGHTSCSPAYDEWLREQGINGDKQVHEAAHKVIYERFRHILPMGVA